MRLHPHRLPNHNSLQEGMQWLGELYMAEAGDSGNPSPDDENEDEFESPEAAQDVACAPGFNSDSRADIERYISTEVRDLYDVFSYRHAASILANSFPDELAELERALLNFSITVKDIGLPGGNESLMPKKFSASLRPCGWREARIQADLVVRMTEFEERAENGRVVRVKSAEREARLLENFIDGHKIDYVKGRVAFDLEWNSKDQTFDRDLYALRTFHECGLISAGVLLTRSASLNPVFARVPQLTKAGQPVLHQSGKRAGKPRSVKAKYGASTTWMGKLLYRLNAGRHGGCPVLAFGIKPKLIRDLNTLGGDLS